jgi:hypothetical protein
VGAGHSDVELGTIMALAIHHWGIRTGGSTDSIATYASAARRPLDRAIFGRAAVCCEECGMPLAAHRAIWRGRRSYCSVEHEAADLA